MSTSKQTGLAAANLSFWISGTLFRSWGKKKPLPGWERLEMVVGHVQNAEVCVARQHWYTLVCQLIVGQVQFLQDAVTLLWQAGWRQVLQLISWCIYTSQAECRNKSEFRFYLPLDMDIKNEDESLYCQTPVWIATSSQLSWELSAEKQTVQLKINATCQIWGTGCREAPPTDCAARPKPPAEGAPLSPAACATGYVPHSASSDCCCITTCGRTNRTRTSEIKHTDCDWEINGLYRWI